MSRTLRGDTSLLGFGVVTRKPRETSSFASRCKSFCLLLAALWLQAVVVICIVKELNQVHTPLSQWAARIRHLVGM